LGLRPVADLQSGLYTDHVLDWKSTKFYIIFARPWWALAVILAERYSPALDVRRMAGGSALLYGVPSKPRNQTIGIWLMCIQVNLDRLLFADVTSSLIVLLSSSTMSSTMRLLVTSGKT
jgi:hypothetical protein